MFVNMRCRVHSLYTQRSALELPTVRAVPHVAVNTSVLHASELQKKIIKLLPQAFAATPVSHKSDGFHQQRELVRVRVDGHSARGQQDNRAEHHPTLH